jgi:sec-independent protein translocase protein TatB
MFDIGWSELLVIGIVALVVIGPKELPSVLRTLSQMMGKVRRMASEFQGQFQEAMREADMADLKKQVDAIGETARGVTDLNPMEAVRREMETAMSETAKIGEANAAAPSAAPSIDVPLPEPVVPVTDADFRQSPVDARADATSPPVAAVEPRSS